jgi:hypothetical protein
MDFKCKVNLEVENTADCAACWIENHKGVELISRPASRVVCKKENAVGCNIHTNSAIV